MSESSVIKAMDQIKVKVGVCTTYCCRDSEYMMFRLDSTNPDIQIIQKLVATQADLYDTTAEELPNCWKTNEGESIKEFEWKQCEYQLYCTMC